MDVHPHLLNKFYHHQLILLNAPPLFNPPYALRRTKKSHTSLTNIHVLRTRLKQYRKRFKGRCSELKLVDLLPLKLIEVTRHPPQFLQQKGLHVGIQLNSIIFTALVGLIVPVSGLL
jgi:hypothetical protein